MIKILIMDDSEEKRNRIKSVLTQRCLVNENSIDEAYSLNSGRVKLSSNFYDLLLLDLVLPINDGEEIEPGRSEDFINELHKFGRFKKPVYIIGLSQYEEKVLENAPKFEDKLWKLIKYDLQNTDWEEILQHAIDSILSTKQQLLESIGNVHKYDFGIICALSEEFEQMKKASGLKWTLLRSEGFGVDFFTSELRTEMGRTLKLVAARDNMAGMQAVSVMAASMFSLFDLKGIFMTGICAGFKKDKKDKIDFGDIFIADSEFDYGSGKLSTSNNGSYLKPEPKSIECCFELKSKINTFIEERHPETYIGRTLKTENLDLMKKEPQIFFSPGACGSYVVADKGFMSLLLEKNRKLRGLDMEGYGLYLAAHMIGRQALMIKCVSDFADTNKGDTYHKMCSYSSAWFLFEFLKYTY